MSTVVDLSQVAAQANRELADASAGEIMSWAYEEFGSRLVVTSSLADTVMVHLAEQAAPGIDVIFLDTGYHFAETIGTRDAVAAVHNVNLINAHAEADRRRTGRHLGQGPVRPQPGPVLRPAQGGSPGRGAGPTTSPGPAASGGPTHRAGRRRRSSSWDLRRKMIKVAPIARWSEPGRGRLHRTELVDDQPAAGRRLRVDRLRAVHGPLRTSRAGRWAGLAKTECGILQ